MHTRRWNIATWLLLLLAVAAWPNPPQSGQDSQKENEKNEKKKESKSERAAEAAALPAVLWRDPGDISSLDLTGGPGGRENAPRAEDRFKFVKEDTNGTSTKFYVKDSNGTEWLVKIGEEAQPETAATRIVWAMGYFADSDYFLPSIHVDGMEKLLHGKDRKHTTADFSNVRLKREGTGEKKIGNWSWYENPFTGTREFNGLRVLMALINNWDLKEINNKIYPEDGMREFVVSDLGASFGRTGAVTKRSKGKIRDYEHSKFIVKITPEFVNFRMATKPSWVLKPFERKNYATRAKMEEIVQNVPLSDAAWIADQLTRLSPDQIRDAFRAAGYSQDVVERYAKAMEARIKELKDDASSHEVRADNTRQ